MKETIGHCPYCTKILFKDAIFKDEADFETNCHHCGKPIMVCVEKALIVIIKPRINVPLSEKPKDACGKPC
jgi:hypothetical protein